MRLWQTTHGTILEELVKVEPNEELLELAFLGQVSNNLVQEAGVVPERVGNALEVELSLLVSANFNSVAAHQEV